MTISIAELTAIANTLPIGFYAKRRVPVSISADAECSCYTPLEDKISISYPQIAKSLEAVTETENKEQLIRSNLYHEVSHAILTPKEMTINDINNIFEDERIETLLRNFYLNVDFEKDVFLMNGLTSIKDVTAPTNAMDAFYNTVRFHVGKPEHLERVQEIIEEHKNIYCYGVKGRPLNNDYLKCHLRDYEADIKKLYEDIAKDFESNSNSSSDYLQDIIQQMIAEGILSPTGEPTDGSIIGSGKGQGLDGMGELVEGIFNKGYFDPKLTESLETIINSFNKKNNGGACLNGYSGVLNPRNFIYRNDYRVFDRMAQTKGNNTFGTFHLNLFVDNSGSFDRNKQAMNTLITSLTEIERKNPNFTLDVIHCGVGQKVIKNVADRFIDCNDGTELTEDIYEQFRTLQKRGTYNYNILLYDGYAGSCHDGGRAFSAFNTNNTTIISDPDNQQFTSKYCKSARVIITTDYVNQIYNNVKSALSCAFR